MFTKILVPVDGSDNSRRALDAALFLSEKLNAKVTAIHVMEDVPVLHIASEKLLRAIGSLQKRKPTYTVGVLGNCYKKELTINSKLLQGNPSSEILDFCEKEKYDIIIMGSRGIGKFKELARGSASSKVLHHSSCPVMIIR